MHVVSHRKSYSLGLCPCTAWMTGSSTKCRNCSEPAACARGACQGFWAELDKLFLTACITCPLQLKNFGLHTSYPCEPNVASLSCRKPDTFSDRGQRSCPRSAQSALSPASKKCYKFTSSQPCDLLKIVSVLYTCLSVILARPELLASNRSPQRFDTAGCTQRPSRESRNNYFLLISLFP